ncbi:diacylglycerol kinase family protein [Falsibacillus pallidus]|uniref:diacylglycerol kinase family protein n=1 Tax=Falsibacillus pallidus TaxID=493781 RepID=UPI003D960C7C
MDLKELRQASKIRQFAASFMFAGNGLKYVMKNERNFKFHIGASIAAIILGILLSLEKWEWLILLLTISSVLSLEIINTAIEKAVDLVTEEYHPTAKLAKDLAAGAVLLAAIFSIIIGCVLFLPKIAHFFL